MATSPEPDKEEKIRLAKDAAKKAAALAAKEHYDRMLNQGYKKYSFFIKTKTMSRLGAIADAKGEPAYLLLNQIIEKYIDDNEADK